MYCVFYAIPASYTHWQDSRHRFSNGHDAVKYAKSWPHARVTDEHGKVLAIAGSEDLPWIYGPFHLQPERT